MIVLFLLVGIVVSWSSNNENRIAMKDIQALTLRENQMTTSRRGNPIPQLNCANCAALGSFRPSSVQCRNMGVNDLGEVQWKCEADMPSAYSFDSLQVSCEGFSRAGDSDVLKGSCGLYFSLKKSPEHSAKPSFDSSRREQPPSTAAAPSGVNLDSQKINRIKTTVESPSSFGFFSFLFFAVCGGLLLCCCCSGHKKKQSSTVIPPVEPANPFAGSAPVFQGPVSNAQFVHPADPVYNPARMTYTQYPLPTQSNAADVATAIALGALASDIARPVHPVHVVSERRVVEQPAAPAPTSESTSRVATGFAGTTVRGGGSETRVQQNTTPNENETNGDVVRRSGFGGSNNR